MEITPEHFEEATGQRPTYDDLERCNCPLAGQHLHKTCGWNHQADLPVFQAGPEYHEGEG